VVIKKTTGDRWRAASGGKIRPNAKGFITHGFCDYVSSVYESRMESAIGCSTDGQTRAGGVVWTGCVMTAPVTVRERDLRALAGIVSEDRPDLPDGKAYRLTAGRPDEPDPLRSSGFRRF